MGSLIANVGSIASIGRAALTGITPALDRIIARSDPALTFNFRVELPNLDGATANNNLLNDIMTGQWSKDSLLNGAIAGAQTVANQVLRGSMLMSAVNEGMEFKNRWSEDFSAFRKELGDEYIETISLPFRAYESRQVLRGGTQAAFPSASTSLDNIQITCYGGTDNEALFYFNCWQHLVSYVSPTDGRSRLYNSPAVYKKNITVTLTDNNAISLVNFVYSGCWPVSINTIELGSSDGYVQYIIDIAVDDMQIQAAEIGSIPFLS